MMGERSGLERPILLAALLVALALPWLAQASGYDFVTGVATRVLILALAALSLNLILGFGGMVSFGHAAFFGTGAYVVGILSYHATLGGPLMTWPIEIGGSESAVVVWPLAMLVAALLALVIGALSLRTSGLYFIMITLAFAQMIYYFAVSLEAYGGDDGLPLWSRSTAGPLALRDDRQFYYLVLALLLLFVLLKARLIAARFGRVLSGIRDNERRMKAIGFPTTRYKLSAFVIAGAVAGLAGALMANQTLFVSPSFLDWPRSGEFLVIVILGGMGSLWGPVAGAVAFILLEELLSGVSVHWRIVFGPLLILVVLFAKQGLWGLVTARRAAVREATGDG